MARKEPNYENVIYYITNSIDKKSKQREFIAAARKAWQGTATSNYYKEKAGEIANSLIKSSDSVQADMGKALKARCNAIPDVKNLVVHNAVETNVSMVMGGIGRYDIAIDDDTSSVAGKELEMIGKALKFTNEKQKIGYRIDDVARRMLTDGVVYWHVGYNSNPETADDFVYTLLDANKVITDPTKYITGVERFIGWEQFESFKDLRKRTVKRNDGYKVKTMDQVEVYLEFIQKIVNGNEVDGDSQFLTYAKKDADIFYSGYMKSQNKTTSKGPADEEPDVYNKDMVNVTYFYDNIEKKRYTVINRRFVVEVGSLETSTTINCEYNYFDATAKKMKTKKSEKKVSYGAPIIEIPYLTSPDYSYPVSPLFFVLDEFNTLCSAESLLSHNMSVAGPITFQATSEDAEKVAQLLGISGEVVENTMVTLGVINKQHDNSPVIGQIQRSEEKIKRTLGATDQFEMQQMVGDRATSREVVAASGAASQRMNTLISRIERGMSEVAELFLKMFVVATDKDRNLTFDYNGEFGEVGKSRLAANLKINAKLQKSIDMETADKARHSMELMNLLFGHPLVNSKKLGAELIPNILSGAMSRSDAESMLSDDVKLIPITQNEPAFGEIDFNAPPVTMDPALAEQFPELIAQAQQAGLAQGGQPQQAQPTQPFTGTTPESGGLVANNAGY